MSERRLENLETVVRALRDEVQQLRDDVVRLREGSAVVAPDHAGRSTSRAPETGRVASQPSSPNGPLTPGIAGGSGSSGGSRPLASAGGSPPDFQSSIDPRDSRHPSSARRSASTPSRAREFDVEALVGRYGTLAVASVLVVMGIGAFVTWAATRIVIGPALRVVLGAIAALLLAAVGRRLAARGAVAFGSTILALALAVAHVDAWAAGPVLHVVPNIVALGAAALASVALAALALRERNETLFAVGVGGALLAPFVTGDRESSVLLLLIYGWVVIASALAAARPRDWVLTTRLVFAGAVLYTGSAVLANVRALSDSIAVGAFALACAWAAYLWGGDRQRAAISLGFVTLGAAALLIVSTREPIQPYIALAVLGTASVYIMLESRAASRGQMVTGVLVLPLMFLLSALASVRFAQQRGAVIALAWALAAMALSRVSHGRRDLHMAAASFSGLAALVLALHHRPVACVVALAGAAVVIAYVALRTDARVGLLPYGVAVLGAALWSHALLAGRVAFAYPPFLTSESLAAGAVVAAAFAGWRFTRHMPRRVGAAGALVFGLALFLWPRAELERAIRPEVATFSLILYYAAAGILGVAIGRGRRIGELRMAGMALALYAAAKAVVEASGLTMIGLRVGSYLLVGGFLLAVAYWYRAASTRSPDQPAAPT